MPVSAAAKGRRATLLATILRGDVQVERHRMILGPRTVFTNAEHGDDGAAAT